MQLKNASVTSIHAYHIYVYNVNFECKKSFYCNFAKICRYRNAWKYRLMWDWKKLSFVSAIYGTLVETDVFLLLCIFQNFNLHTFKVKVNAPCVLSKNINISPPKYLERQFKLSQSMLTFPLSSFATCFGGKTKNVSMPFSRRYSHLSPPFPGSSSNSPCRLSLVVWEICTLLRGIKPLFKKRYPLKNSQGHKASRFLPRNPSGLHLICHCDIRGPNVKLPPLLAKNSPQNGAGVDAHAHVHLSLGLLAHVPEATGPPHTNYIYLSPFCPLLHAFICVFLWRFPVR